MTTIDTRAAALPSPGLEAFERSARQADAVRVVLDGDSFQVLGQGQLPTAQGMRSVAWVQSDQADTTRMFVDALAQTYGGGISQAVARELGLDPAPGKPLASRLVHQAIDAANTGRQALSGVDFLTQIDHSATAQGGAFRAKLQALGLDTTPLDTATRQAIDQQMREQFEHAARQGQVPVSAATAGQWLEAALLPLTKLPR